MMYGILGDTMIATCAVLIIMLAFNTWSMGEPGDTDA